MGEETVIVTGCSSGIGLETALFLAERGFRVTATMRDLARGEILRSEAERRRVQMETLRLDITDAQSIRRAVDTVLERSGEIFGLVNNAGINIRGFFEDLSQEEMRRVFEVNVFGTMAVSRSVLPSMRSKGRGRIVLISSVGGRLPALGSSAYCASKFSLEGFGQTLAQEVSPFGIRVSVVEPGLVHTELFGRNRILAGRALDPAGPYREWFLNLEAFTDRMVNSPATTPRDVAQAVFRALRAKRPKLHYLVGRRTRVLVALRRFLPEELFDRVWMREAQRRIQRTAGQSHRARR